ncbi:hypothetical protein BSKO_13965 [Bryopsis sp. KO-2023]|nr:hypothetical protein BSKO_13965 [Bryopsis sp. KO-2023]
MMLRVEFSLAVFVTLFGLSVCQGANSDCGKTRLVCGTSCGDEFCQFPDYCGNPSCKRCTKTRKTCREVLQPCGVGLKCKYNERCIRQPCIDDQGGCEGGGEISFCVPLPKEEYKQCEEVERSRCMGVDDAGLPKPNIIAKYAPRVVDGWEQGNKCGVAYCPKGRGCMKVKEKSCVGALEECGEIDCPAGYECVDEPSCEHTCDSTVPDACIKIDLRFDNPVGAPSCERVPDCG